MQTSRVPWLKFVAALVVAAAGFAVPGLAHGQQIVTTRSGNDFTLQVGSGTTLNDFKLHFKENQGAGIDDWFDVDSESSPTTFGPELTSTTTLCQYGNLIHTNLGKSGAGNDLTDACDVSSNRLTALEISPTRTILKGTSQLAPWGGGSATTSWESVTTYAVYANGRVYGKRTMKKTADNLLATTWNYPLRLVTTYNAANDPFRGADQTLYAMATATTGEFASHASDDFWMLYSSASTYVGDAAVTLSTDWALSDLMQAMRFTSTGYLRMSPKDTTSRNWNAGDMDTFRYLLQLKPNNRNNNQVQANYSNDYRYPDTPLVASGTAETTNTGDANNDGYNEEEGTYEVRAASHQYGATFHGASNATTTVSVSGCSGAGATSITVGSTTGFDSAGYAELNGDIFSYTGTTATTFTGIPAGGAYAIAACANGNPVVAHNLYNPTLKVHEFYPQTGSGLTQRTKLHSRLDDSAGNTTVTAQVGTNGTASGNTSSLTTSTGERASGLDLDANGEYASFSTSDLSDWGQGTIELWYRPEYDFNQGSAPTKYIFGTNVSGTANAIWLKHEDDGSGSNNHIRFGLKDNDGSPVEHYVEIRASDYPQLWVAYEWVHLRLTWDKNATTDNLKIYVNGQYLTQYNTAETSWTTFAPGATIYLGDYQSGGNKTASGSFDEFYIHDDVIAGPLDAPVILDTIYKTNTVTTVNGSPTVTGASTAWMANLRSGQAIRIIGDGDEKWYKIKSVDTDTQITLNANYQGTGSSGKSYEAGGTVIVLPQVKVGGVAKAIGTDFNLAEANAASSYIIQYLSNITSSSTVFQVDNNLVSSTLTQNAYRFYTNADSLTLSDPWPIGATDVAESTAVSTSTGPITGSILRLRMSLLGGITDVPDGTQAFKLQFAENWVCSAVPQWFDVGDTGSTTAAWRGYNNASVTDGSTITSRLLTPSDVNQSYVEQNNSPTNPNTLSPSLDGEWDWVLHANSININSSYCFRMVKSDGTALDTYTNYPRVNTTSSVPAVTYNQSRYRLYANANAITPTDPWPVGGTDLAENTAAAAANGPLSGNVLRLRTALTTGGADLSATTQAFKLQFGSNATCSSVSAWQDVPDSSSSTAPWRAYDNAGVTNGSTISSLLLSTATVGGSYVEQNNSPTNPNAITSGGVGEWDWAVEANSLSPATSYCFRVVKSDGTALDTYTVYPQLTTTSTTFATTTFQGGNGETFVRTNDAVSFDSTRDPGTGDTRHTTWFYFSMNFAKGKSIDFTLNNARGANTENTNWANIRPVYSYDQTNWTHIASDATGAASPDDPLLFTGPGGGATFTSDTVYLAYNIPYTYADAQTAIARWQATPFVSSTAVLGQSVNGRDLHLLTFEDTNSPVLYRNKRVMWLTSRAHPMEPGGNYALDGVVDFYVSTTDPESETFRRGWILKVVPDYNADGMYGGYTRSNANGYDLNREWDTGGPNAGTEETEVYQIHSAINTWAGLSYSTSTVHYDMHTQASAPPSSFRGNASMGTTILEDNLDTILNLPYTSPGTSSGGKFNVQMYAQYSVPSYTVEGPDIRWDATNYPSIANFRAWGRAWAEAAISQYEYNARIFAFRESTVGTAGTTQTLVIAPGKFQLVFDDAKGGALTKWYDQENNTTHNAQLGDTTYGVDRLEWHDGTAMRALASSTGVSTTVQITNGAFVKLVTTGNFGGQSGLPYTLTRFIGEDGRIFTTFELTNSTGSSVNWGTMTQYLSVNNTNFNFVYDNTNSSPAAGTDNWFSQVGTSAGSPTIKAVAAAFFVTSTGGFAYDTYSSQTGTPRWNYYRDADGPTQGNGAVVTTTWAFQLNPDNDTNGSQAQLDAYGNDLAHLDRPSMTLGTFAGFSTTTGALEFAASSGVTQFTYTNAATYTKKKPIFHITGYTGAKAPVLRVNNSFLDGESGSAHPTTTHIGASYTSWVSTTLQEAYVQYLSDISSNVDMKMGNTVTADAPTDPSGAAATYNNDSQVTLGWTDNSSNEDNFVVERRTDTGSGYGSYTALATTSANVVSYADTSVAANRKYQYRVRAYSSTSGYSGYSTDASDVYTTPSAPTIGTPTADTANAITWAWTDNSAFEQAFNIEFTTGGGSFVTGISANATSYQTTGLATNTAYVVKVGAYRSDRGSATSSNSATIYTLAGIPAGLGAVGNSTSQVTASWTANGNPGGTEYYVENTTASTNSGWTTATSWASTGLSCGTTYTFRVKARNASNVETSFTATANGATSACPTPPTAPSGAGATYNSDSQITLGWTDNSSDEDNFVVERRDDTGSGYGSYAVVATTSAGVVSYADTSVAANRKYQYRVRAYNVGGYSAYSTDGSDVYTTQAAPTSIAGVADSTTAITWSWTDNAAFESSYRFGLTSGGSTYVTGQAANTTSYQVTGLSANLPYTGQAATFRADRGVASSSASAAAYTQANPPTSLAVIDNSTSQITASWNANSNPGGTEFYAENTTAGTASGWAAATSWSSTSLSCGTSYTFRVKARNGNGTETAYAVSASTSTAACPPSSGGGTSGGGAPAIIPPSSGSGQGNVDPGVGGTISQSIPAASGQAQVVFPTGAILGTAVVSVVPQSAAAVNLAAPLPAGLSLAAGMAAQVFAYQGVMTVTTLLQPVTVRFSYSDAALGGLNESTLAIHTWDEASRRWVRLPDSHVDTSSNVVTATTNHFSLFAVLAGGVVQAPGGPQLLKTSADPAIYVVTPTGFRRHIPSEAAFNSYGYRWSDVATVSASSLAAYPVTGLIKVAGDPRVYLASGGTRRLVPDEATFLARGYTWNAVSEVSAVEMAAYADGAALGAPSTPVAPPAAPVSTGGSIRSFLSVGSTGQEVRILQAKLKAAGYYTYPTVTGRYGAATRDAVVRFQRAKGIDPKGYVGPATRAAVNALP